MSERRELSEVEKVRRDVLVMVLAAMDWEMGNLRAELEGLRAICSHPRLPKRELHEEHRDECPDCGFVSWCYAWPPEVEWEERKP